MAVNVTGGPLEFVAAINDSDFGQTIRRMEGDLKRLTQTASQESSAIEGFAQKATTALASYLSLNAAKDFAAQIINVRSEFQSLDISFKTILGSREKATALMADVVKLASVTPFTLQEVGTGAKQLLAYGTEAGKVVDTLKTLGDIASGVSAPIGDLVYLYGTLQTQGRAYTRDILQFTSRGIPIIEELAKQFGVNKDKVQELVEAGKVGFPEVEKAFKSLTSAGGSFFNLMEQQSKTLNGQISNLKDAISLMLNSIGQSQEGIIGSSIQGLTGLVKNYQNVLDILKVLVLTYGAYRTVLALTVVTQGLQERAALQAALAGQTLTKSQLAAATATRVLQGAFTTLYTAIASAAPILALTAITAAIYAMATASDAQAEALSKIKDVQVEASQAVEKEKSKIDELLKVYNDRNKSNAEHATALAKIIELNPRYLSGLNANNIATQEGQVIIDKYLRALNEKATGEAAYAAKQANTLKIIELQTKGISAISSTERLGQSLNKFVHGQFVNDADIVTGMIGDLTKANEKIQSTFGKEITKSVLGEDLNAGATGAKVKRSLSTIEAEIKALKDKQTGESTSSKEFIKFQNQINALEKEAEAIRGKSAGQLRAIKAEENKTLAINEKKKTLLNDIEALHREAAQSGLPKEASEVDKINEKYDIALRKISEFDQKYPKNKITTVEIQQLGNDRLTEVANAQLRKDAEDYKKHLEEQKDVFSQYQEAIKSIGIDKANEMFAGQTKGFDNYLEYLQAEHDKLIAELAGGRDIGLDAKLKANAEQIVEAQNQARKVAYENLVRLSTATESFAEHRKNIEIKYQSDIAILQNNFKGEGLKTRLEILKKSHEAELLELENNIARQSSLYQKLNEDILRYTREQLKQRKKDLKDILNKGEYFDKDKQAFLPITPVMIADINSALSTTNGLLSDTKKIAGLTKEEFAKVLKDIQIASSALNSLGDAFAGINTNISDTLGELGTLADIAGNVVKGITTGDPSAIIAAVTGVIKIFDEAKQSRIQTQKDTEAFLFAQASGELEINATYRERLRTQKDINELKLDGLKKENTLLASQKTEIEDQYKKIFDLIQKQSFVSGKKDQKSIYKTRAVDQFDSLSGKTYDDLEKLFVSGQLDAKAKALFEQLKKLKQEGIDIDAALEENKKKAAEIFTGTTADNIINSIADGFANGFKSVQDFADKTEDVVRSAMINALKYQTLEAPLKKLFEQFAADAESGGGLDLTEVANFTSSLNKTIDDAAKFADQIQKATGVNLSKVTSSGGGNNLITAVKSLTEDTAQLLAGNLGGIRLTAIQALSIAQSALNTLNKIENNTSMIRDTNDYLRKFDTQGIKLRA